MRPLNLDILAIVVGEMHSRDALPISTACKSIHRIVVRNTLSSVEISSPRAMAGFPEFVLAGPNHCRIPMIRSLCVHIRAFPEQIWEADWDQMRNMVNEDELACIKKFVSLLTLILTRSRNLRVLDLHFGSYLLVEFPELRNAFMNTECLVELHVRTPTEPVMESVKDIRSTLRFLALECPPDLMTDTDPPSIFSTMINQPYLECLELDAAPDTAISLDGIVTQWPAMRSLIVKGCIPMTPFVKAFPNVRSLCVGSLEPFEWAYDTNDYEPPVQWASLDHLEGASEDLREWDIHCPVRWLELKTIVDHDPDMTMVETSSVCSAAWQEQTLDIIQSTAPMILSLSIYTDVGIEFWAELASITGQVKLLELTVYDTLDDFEGSDMYSWMTCVPELLGSLEVLCLCIRFAALDGDPDCSSSQREDDLRAAIAGLQDLLAKSLPNLQYIAIADGPFRRKKITVDKPELACAREDPESEYIPLTEERSWWRVVNFEGAGEKRLTKQISRWNGERLRERLHSMGYKELSDLRELSL